MKKVRRFNGEDDSYVEGTASSLADDANDQFREDQTARMMRLARGESGDGPVASASRSMAPAETEPAAAAPKPQNFKSAFADARSAGNKTFEFGGKKYTTELAKPSAPSTPAAAPKADTPVERELPPMSAKERAAAIAQIPLDDEREPVKGKSASGSELGRNFSNTLSALPISRGIQAAQSGAKLAGRKAAEEFVKKDPIFRNRELEILKDIPKLLGGPKKQLALPAPPSRLALPAPPKRLPYDRPAASAAESTKAKLAGELRRGAQPTKFTSPSKSTTSKKTRKFNEDEGGVEFRRGGSVSSASKRADGCAIRGKTRA